MTKTFELEITNTNKNRPYPVPQGREVGPGSTVAVRAREPEIKPLQGNKHLEVKVLRVNEEKEQRVSLADAEKALADAERDREKASARLSELTSKASDLNRRLKVAETEELEAKKAAALAGDSVRVASEMSEASTIREEIEETGYQVWAARIAAHQAEAAVHEKRAPVVAARQRQLRRELEKAEKRIREAEAKRDGIRSELRSVGDAFFERRRARAARQKAREVEKQSPAV